ncbi:MAG: hypothetical protein JNK04_25975 [Myxococcales bacterium]|nr:hypothetical protein [Myxococcales bacterium]
MKHAFARVLCLATVCLPPSGKLPDPVPSPSGSASGAPAKVLHQPAIDEARLRPLTDKDPMLAVWPGPHGGTHWEAYRQLRGRDSDTTALSKKRGVPVE